MQHVLGIILRNNENEIMESESPEKSSFLGLQMAIMEAEKRLKQNANIKQINVYSIKHGQRILAQKLVSDS